MRVLYVTYHPVTASETYVSTEIEWMRRAGVEVFMLAIAPHISRHPLPIPEDHLRWKGKLSDAIRQFNVDIVHAHTLVVPLIYYANELADIRKPITIRGHSFDFSPILVDKLAAFDPVKRIWLFPHFAAMLTPNPKVRPLTVCYVESIFRPGRSDGKVLRVGAGLRSKRIEEFLEIARLCPRTQFELIITRVNEEPDYPDTLAAQAPPNLLIKTNLQREEMAASFSEGSWYVAGRPTHSFAMPTSVSEAMGCGVTPIMPDVPGAHAYTGDAAYYFNNIEEAADIINHQKTRRDIAIEQAKLYATATVLPTILAEWKSLIKK